MHKASVLVGIVRSHLRFFPLGNVDFLKCVASINPSCVLFLLIDCCLEERENDLMNDVLRELLCVFAQGL